MPSKPPPLYDYPVELIYIPKTIEKDGRDAPKMIEVTVPITSNTMSDQWAWFDAKNQKLTVSVP